MTIKATAAKRAKHEIFQEYVEQAVRDHGEVVCRLPITGVLSTPDYKRIQQELRSIGGLIGEIIIAEQSTTDTHLEIKTLAEPQAVLQALVAASIHSIDLLDGVRAQHDKARPLTSLYALPAGSVVRHGDLVLSDEEWTEVSGIHVGRTVEAGERYARPG